MLGIPRIYATMTASALQQAGLISYKRGVITITDEQRLAETACECYSTVKKVAEEFCK